MNRGLTDLGILPCPIGENKPDKEIQGYYDY